jgi:GTP-binding protein
MQNMVQDDNNRVFLEYTIPSRGLLVFVLFPSLSKGYAVSQSIFLEYQAYKGEIPARVNGVMIAKDSGDAASYAYLKLEDRGYMIIPPGAEVYPGMSWRT